MDAEFNLQGKIIITDRLILRPFKQADLADFYAYASVPGVGEKAGWSHHRDLAETNKILQQFISEDKTFAICERQSGRVIGSIGVEKYGRKSLPELDKLAALAGRELGFVLSKTYWNQGLMTEAVQAVIDYLFNELQLDFLVCSYFTTNQASRRVQEKCGFVHIGQIHIPTQLGDIQVSEVGILLNKP